MMSIAHREKLVLLTMFDTKAHETIDIRKKKIDTYINYAKL
jgi:hypothetical protein